MARPRLRHDMRHLAALAGALAPALMLAGCLGSTATPDLKGKSIAANLQQPPTERVVVDRNYELGQRYRVETGQVMIRNKLYVLTAEAAGAYRAAAALSLVADTARLDIVMGSEFRVSDRVLVKGRLAHVLPLAQATPEGVRALLVNDDGTFVSAAIGPAGVMPFANFAVEPKDARLTPVTQDSIKTSAGYVNYDVVFNGGRVMEPGSCAPPAAVGKPPDPQRLDKAPASCAPVPHLDLTLLEYDRLRLDRVSSARRSFYAVLDGMLQLPGLQVKVHEYADARAVFEVIKDDNAYVKTVK